VAAGVSPARPPEEASSLNTYAASPAPARAARRAGETPAATGQQIA
jgi:hypothetical protein